MKTTITYWGKFIVLCLISFHVKAQMNVDYVKGIGLPLEQVGNSIAVDASGNTFVAGAFAGTTVDFNPGGTARTLSSSSTSNDIYLAKYDASGFIVNATDLYGRGTVNDIDKANKVYLDAAGNVYLVGTFFGMITFGTTGFIGRLDGGSGRAFVAKFNNSLTLQWAIAIGDGIGTTEAKDVVVDGSGNVYVTGEFQGTTNFNPGHGVPAAYGPGAEAGPYNAMNITSNGATDMFVAKYNSGGKCQWVSTAGGTSSDQGLGIDYDDAGNIYVTGAYIGQNIDFDPSGTTFNLSEYGAGASGDAFVAKYSSTGALLGAFSLGSALVEKSNSISVEKSTGDFVIAGYFLKDINPVDFDPSGAVANGVGSAMNDMFIAKYSSNLTYQWHKVIASTGNDAANAVKLVGATLYVTGSYSGTATNFGDAKTLTSSGGTDVFVASYAFASGTCLAAYSMGGAANEEGRGIAKSGSKVYLTGAYQGSGDYDPTAGTATLNHTGGVNDNDIFIGKYTDVICTLPTIDTDPVGLARCQGSSASFTVAASGPGPITYQWKKGGADIASQTSATYNIAAVAVGDAANYTVAVTNTCGTVTSAIAALTVSTPVTSNAGTAQALCNSTTATLAGNNPSPGTGAWTTTAGTGLVTTSGSATSGVTGLTVGSSSTFLWTITNGACVTTSSVTITSSSPVTSNAGTAQVLCNASTATLAATVPATGTGAWTTTAGTGVVTTPGSATSGVTTLTVGAASTFQWTVTNGACSASSTVTITSSAPVTSNAGTFQAVCNSTTATLAATVPALGTGAWTTTLGTGSATTPSSATSAVTGLTIGTSSTFQWTVTNGACNASSTVTITSSLPVTSNAGTAQTVCNSTTATLAATVPSLGTGAWTTVTGTGVATTPSSATSGVTGLTVGAATTFRWTVTNGGCTANTTVVITSNASVTSNAGTAQTICNSTTATLAATVPALGTGAWTTVMGTGVATTPSSETSGVTGLTVGATSTFRWTVTNGACTANSTVIVTVSAPVTSNAGTAQTICNSTTATLAATVPTLGLGIWATTSGTGVVTTANSATSAVTGLTVGASSTFEWTVYNGACNASSTVTITSSSPVTSNAGTAQALCNATTATLAATVPSLGTGAWTTTAGTGVVTTANSATSGVTGLTLDDASTFQWTVTNGACNVSSTVTITSSSPVSSNAGTSETVCNSTTATLVAVAPSLPATGAWTTVTGTGIVTSPSFVISGVTGLTVGSSSTFRWTVTNGACSANSTVTITSSSPVTANAGPAQSLCNTTTTTLAATVPSLGTGAWTTTAGTGVATTPSSNASAVTGLTIGAATTFQWTVTNGACVSNSTVTVTVSAPGVPDAGTDQTLCNVTTTNLAASGTGAWSKISGAGTVSTPSSPTSGVMGLTVGTTSVFEWTVTNGACSGSSQVSITVSAPVTSNAGTAQSLCNTTTTTLAATVPSLGTGAWSTTAGTGTASTLNSATSAVTGLTIGSPSTFRWTVTNGACSANSSVIITVSSPVTSNAGPAQTICNATTATLAATVPSLGTGSWIKTAGSGTVTTSSSATSGITGLTVGASSTFQWTVTNGACSASSSVMITSNAPVTANAGPTQNICNTTTATLAATVPSVGAGAWTTSSGTGIATTPSSASSGVTGLTIGSPSTFQWTVTNGACNANASVTIHVASPITFTTHPDDDNKCTGSPTSFTGSVSGSLPITYQWKKGITDVTNNATVSGATTTTLSISSLVVGDAGTYTLVATNGCGAVSSNPATLTVSTSVLSITTQPVSQALCSSSNLTFNVVATGTGVLTYQWKKEGGNVSNGGTISGANTSSLNISSIVTADAGNYILDVSNLCGTLTSNVAVLTVDQAAITTQPVDQQVCPDATAVFTVSAIGPSVTYQWQKNSVDIPTETSSTLTLNNVSATDETSYRCQVTACSNTIASNTADLILEICTNTFDPLSEDQLLLYPNPTRSAVHVKLRGNDMIRTIMVVDATGTVVYTQQNILSNTSNITLDGLPQGLYHVIIDASSGRRVEKLEVLN